MSTRGTLAVAAFMAAGLMLGLGLLAHAQLGGLTVFECDREANSCVLADAKPFWREDLDRFPARDVTSAKHVVVPRGKTQYDCAHIAVASRMGPVEICGRAGPDYAQAINAWIADPSRPRLALSRDTGWASRVLALIVAACAIPPFLAGLYLAITAARRPR